ncbi:MAG: hypothetical protein OXL68_06530 [Paracoccaceae bacterium]|nr:hypothetical protein [Paracoccaceae bacterium]
MFHADVEGMQDLANGNIAGVIMDSIPAACLITKSSPPLRGMPNIEQFYELDWPVNQSEPNLFSAAKKTPGLGRGRLLRGDLQTSHQIRSETRKPDSQPAAGISGTASNGDPFPGTANTAAGTSLGKWTSLSRHLLDLTPNGHKLFCKKLREQGEHCFQIHWGGLQAPVRDSMSVKI